ncbi:BZ3500_MvSof-1268-A1-R1_Chr5-2g07787 [Microbotryum saponariae]|uniref:BZ3500_MvSof-1268-A1-R1_Chr5-2g07787 protein n=1 Tax=Microbotryum saponariae TaxID=289078 RepID=A0A2X0KGH8_9BASI|nr:BZ3500_MvSof-1268-A1-R1_Chr5-2g07787 [Microbotryum saponariae]SDA05656.1 BZ3501_MvSof-1269-A2-R1_Chr5-2g07609 [Microbotryum saponariae]
MTSSSSTSATQAKVLSIIRQRCETVLQAGTSEPGFGWQQAASCRLGDVQVSGVDLAEDDEEDTAPRKGAQALTTVELEVDDGMCNLSGNAVSIIAILCNVLLTIRGTAQTSIVFLQHGGFLAWLIDHCSSLSLIALAGHGRWATSGVSTNLTVNYISAAPSGTPLKVVTRVLQQSKTSSLLETRVEHAETGRLVAFGTHVKQDTPSLMIKWPKGSAKL